MVRTLIPTDALKFTSEKRHNRCYLEIIGIPFDQAGEPVGEGFLFSKNIDLDFDDKGLAAFLEYESFGPTVETEVPQSSVRLVVVLRQKPSGKLSSATYAVD